MVPITRHLKARTALFIGWVAFYKPENLLLLVVLFSGVSRHHSPLPPARPNMQVTIAHYAKNEQFLENAPLFHISISSVFCQFGIDWVFRGFCWGLLQSLFGGGKRGQASLLLVEHHIEKWPLTASEAATWSLKIAPETDTSSFQAWLETWTKLPLIGNFG